MLDTPPDPQETTMAAMLPNPMDLLQHLSYGTQSAYLDRDAQAWPLAAPVIVKGETRTTAVFVPSETAQYDEYGPGQGRWVILVDTAADEPVFIDLPAETPAFNVAATARTIAGPVPLSLDLSAYRASHAGTPAPDQQGSWIFRAGHNGVETVRSGSYAAAIAGLDRRIAWALLP